MARIKFDFIKLSDDLNYAEYSDEFSTGMQEAWDLLEKASGSRVIDKYGEPVKTMIVDLGVIRKRGGYYGLKKKDREYLVDLIREHEAEK
jgi:hypothetical protein